MNSRDLRIGNHVYTHGKIAVVHALDSIEDGFHISALPIEPFTIDYKEVSVEPIPLNHAFLHACCGFDETGTIETGLGHPMMYLQLDENLRLQILNEAREVIMHLGEVRFLHQLQNLFYMLTKKELEIRVASELVGW